MKKLKVNPKLINLLKEIISEKPSSKTKVARLIVSLNEIGRPEEDFLKPDNQVDYISFSRKEKEKGKLRYMRPKKLAEFISKSEEEGETVNDDLIYKKAIPTRSKPTTFLKRVLKKEVYENLVSKSDIENFSYQITSKFSELQFRVVEGEDVRKYYDVRNYHSENTGGTLHGSCMANRTNHLNLLVENPKNVKMLVAFKDDPNDGGKEKVIARALLWEDVQFVDKGVKGKFMDRIYYIKDFMQENFKNWAIANDYFYKVNQSHDSYNSFVSPKGEQFNSVVKTKIENIQFPKYPYLDTFFKPDWRKKTLSNHGNNGNLRDYSGGTAPYYWDEILNKAVTRNDNPVWSDVHKQWIAANNTQRIDEDVYHKNACESDDFGGFKIPDEELIECVLTGKKFSPRYAVDSKFHKGKIHKLVAVKINESWVHKDAVVKSKFFNKNIIKEDALKIGDDYIPSEFSKFGITEKNGSEFLEVLKKYKSFDLDSFEEELELNFD